MKRLAIALLAMATAFAITPSASADTLTPLTSSPTILDPNTVTAPVGGTQVATITNTVTNGSLSATYTESVYTGATDNPFGASDLTFVISITGVGTDEIGEISTANFGTYSVDEGNLTGSGNAGIYADLGDDLDGAVTLFLSGGLAAGDTSQTIVLYTNGTTVENGQINLQDSVNVSGPAFALTPEPGSLLLLGTGLFGLAFLAFRKRAKSSAHQALTLA